MKNAIGIIFGNNSSNILQGLAQDRPIAAVPFGGRYRLLDFALSSMVNSGIRTVGLITPQHYRPMLDHLGAGKDWFLDRKSGGLFILPGAFCGLNGCISQFSIKDLLLNIELLEKEDAQNVVISSCDQVFNINYQTALEYHEQNTVDVTLIYKQTDIPSEQENRVNLILGKDQTVHKILDESKYFETMHPESEVQQLNTFVDILIIRREILLDIIHVYKSHEAMELLDAISENLNLLRVRAYLLKSYIGRIASIQDYFQRNMELLKPDIRDNLFITKRPIHSKNRDNPPTKFGANAQVKNSLISCGCTLEGEVQNSILSRGVVVEPGCQIRNSIIMSRCRIGKNSILENVILDKFVDVNAGNVLKGNERNPLVVYKKSVV